MIEITRLIAKQVRTIFKKALGLSGSSPCPDLQLKTGPFGIIIQAQANDNAVEFHQPCQRTEAELTIPFGLLEDVQGPRNDPITLSTPKKNTLAASWDEKGVTRSIQYKLPKAGDKAFPELPASSMVNPPGLLAALRDAFETTDENSSRYALGCVQLRGSSGQIAATDGHQLLLQSGFSLGFTDELLAQSTAVFGCKELPQDQQVHIGRTDKHVVVRVGFWMFFLKLGSGRFPRIDDVIPSTINTNTTLELSPADAEFVVENLNRLPGSAEEKAVTLDLNGSVSVRSKTIDTPQPAELVLTNSRKTGDDIQLCTDRRFLERAAAMRFGSFHLFGADSNVVLARDDSRSYVWVPLDKAGIVPASNDCLRIESPYGARPKYHPPTYIPRTTVPMNNRLPSPTTTAPNQQPEQSSQQSEQSSQPARRRRRTNSQTPGSIEQAIILRDQLRTTLTSTKDLIRALKAEKRHQRLLRTTLASLKELQKVA